MDIRTRNPFDGANPGRSVAVGGGGPEAGDGPAQDLEVQISEVGDELMTSIREVIDSAGVGDSGPQVLARTLGVDKVLASRVLRATRNQDPMTATHRMPGPEPLRRLVKAASKRGASPDSVERAGKAIDRFDRFVRERIGDRSLLDAILSAWVPEARAEFELRRKQSAFKAISQLKGHQAEVIASAVLLTPSSDGSHIDVTWLNGLIRVQRLRPGVGVKISTRRFTVGDPDRQPMTLGGEPAEHELAALLLPEFCTEPPPKLRAQRAGDVMHYTLADEGFGPRSSVDLIFAEVNRTEIPRSVPAGSNRKAYFFTETVTPAKVLHFDVLVDESLYPGRDPSLRLYDTSFEGVADVNDPTRDIDQLDLLESIESLGTGIGRMRSGDVPRYAQLIRHVTERIGADGSRLRGYRCRIDYPLYGSQVAMVFDPPTHESGG